MGWISLKGRQDNNKPTFDKEIKESECGSMTMFVNQALTESNFKHCFGDLPIETQKRLAIQIRVIERIIDMRRY